jgi:hypothetical protein
MKNRPIQVKDKTAVKSKMKKAPSVPMDVVSRPKKTMQGGYQLSDTPMSMKERESMKAAKDKKAISSLVSRYGLK